MIVPEIAIRSKQGKMTEMLLWFAILQFHNKRAWFIPDATLRSAVGDRLIVVIIVILPALKVIVVSMPLLSAGNFFFLVASMTDRSRTSAQSTCAVRLTSGSSRRAIKTVLCSV